MDFKDIPKEFQEDIFGLKHGSYTIECDVNDAIDQATDWKDAKSTIESRMTDLIGEALNTINKICSGSMALVDFKGLAEKMVKKGFTKEQIFPNGNLSEGNFDGWTNTLIDLLEDDVQIETKVRKIITGEK